MPVRLYGRIAGRYQLAEYSRRLRLVAIAMVFLVSIVAPLIHITPVSALTAQIVPNSDVTAGWSVLGGTSDASCAGGIHCNYVDEGATANDTDYVSTGTALAGVTEEFGLSTLTGVATVRSVKVWARVNTVTINGGTADTVSINLRVGGTLQTASVQTPVRGEYGWLSANFSGSFTQAQLDGMQIQVVRTVLGGGNAAAQDDDVRLSAVYADVTYTGAFTLDQSGYRWFSNQDSSALSFVTVTGGTKDDYGQSIVQTTDGGYAITGQTESYGAAGDMFLTKYDSAGTLSFSRTWGGNGDDQGKSIVQTTDGGYAITGQTISFGAGQEDMFLAKYNSAGTLSFSRTWGGTGIDYGDSLVQTTDGGYAIAGSTTIAGAGSYDMFLAKYNSAGTLSFSRTWGGTASDFGASLVQTTDGGYAITGRTDNFSAGQEDMFLAKYDSAGTLSFSRTWGGTGRDYGYSLVQTTDGGYAVTGQTTSFGAGSVDMFLIKYDSAGTLSFSRTWGGTNTDVGLSLVKTTDGGYAVTGYSNSFDVMLCADALGTVARCHDMFLTKYDSAGNIVNCGANCTTPTATTTTPTVTTTSPTMTQKFVEALGPGINVAAPLAATNTATTAPSETTPFRLRMNLHAGGSAIGAGDASLKLQYAARGTDNLCDSTFTGETYADVNTTSSVINYYNNPVAVDGQPLATNANDPTHGADTIVRQSYQESNNFEVSNTIAVNQDGLWDFALVDAGAPASTSYCFRAVQASGAVLNTYTVLPEITTAASTLDQASARIYKTGIRWRVVLWGVWGASTMSLATPSSKPPTVATLSLAKPPASALVLTTCSSPNTTPPAH